MEYLLLHGAFQKSNVWSELVSLLKKEGHLVQAISLPGRDGCLGNIAQICLAHYVDAVLKALHKFNNKCRLVCHSFAGIHGAVAVSRCVEKIERLVFIAANIANEGETTYSLLPTSFQAKLRTAVQKTGDFEFPGDAKVDLFNCSQENQCDEIEEDIGAKFLCREPALPYFGVVRYENDWRSCLDGRIRYYRGTKDRAINEYQARQYALKAGVLPIPIEGDHQLMLSNPIELVKELTN